MGGARVGLAVGWSCRLALLVLASVLPCLSLHAPPRADEGTAPVAPSRRSCAGHRTEVLPLAGVPRRHGVLAQRLRGGLVGGHAAPQPVTAGCKAGDDAQDSEPQEEGKWRPMCRICYDEEPEGLFTPCKCSGSMRYVHKECLRHWRAVNVRERAYTHCPMCAFEYKLSDSASSAPPDTWTYKVARSLATNECAVTATMLSLAVTLIGESVENSGLAEALVQRFPALQRLRFVPPPTPRRPGPWLPGKAPRADGGLWSWSGAAAQGNGVGAQSKVSPVDSSNAALLFDVEEVLALTAAPSARQDACAHTHTHIHTHTHTHTHTHAHTHTRGTLTCVGSRMRSEYTAKTAVLLGLFVRGVHDSREHSSSHVRQRRARVGHFRSLHRHGGGGPFLVPAVRFCAFSPVPSEATRRRSGCLECEPRALTLQT